MTQLLENPYEMRAEIWRELPSNPKYLVSNLGRVRLEKRLRKDGRRLAESIITLVNGRYGIIKNGKKTVITPKKAVIDAFNIVRIDHISSDNEVWEVVDGYEDYRISTLGRVKSYKKMNPLEGKIIKPQPKIFGHLYVTLRKEKIKKIFGVHQLVALAFIPNPNKKQWVNHINRKPSDNRVENLEWVTARENKYHGNSVGKNPCIILINGKYLVKTQFENKPHSIGRFHTLEEAVKARDNFFKEHNITNKYL